MQWLRAFNVALNKGPSRELTEKTPCDDVMLLAAQSLHTAFVRPGAGCPRNVQMILAAVVALRAALTHSPHNAELRLEVNHRKPFLHYLLCLFCPFSSLSAHFASL